MVQQEWNIPQMALSLLGFPLIFSCAGGGSGKASQRRSQPGPQAGKAPSAPGRWRASQVQEVNPGIRRLGRMRPLAPWGLAWLSTSRQDFWGMGIPICQVVGVWKPLGTWWLHSAALMWISQYPSELSRMLPNFLRSRFRDAGNRHPVALGEI